MDTSLIVQQPAVKPGMTTCVIIIQGDNGQAADLVPSGGMTKR